METDSTSANASPFSILSPTSGSSTEIILIQLALDEVGKTQMNMLVVNPDPDMLFTDFDDSFHGHLEHRSL